MAKIIPLYKSFEFQEKLNRCLQGDGDECLDSLIEEIESYLQRKPDDEDAVLYLSLALKARGYKKRALEVVENFVNSYLSPKLLFYLINLYIDTLDFKKAMEVINTLKRLPLTQKGKEKVAAYEALLYFNMKNPEKIANLFKEFGRQFSKVLFSILSSESAGCILRFYKGYQEGKEWLSTKEWLRKAFDVLKKHYPEHSVFLIIESDEEYPDWKTPVFYIVGELPNLSTDEFVDWKLSKEEEAEKLIQPFVKELTIVRF
ncbi:tetratricopeptide repeat protein [Desulfurobacterium crinifex]